MRIALMTPLDHSLNWIDGELMEGSAVFVVGLALLVSAFALRNFGESAATKAFFWPGLTLGLLFASMTLPGICNNFRRQSLFRESYQQDPAGFVLAEISRVTNFMDWYFYTYLVGSILIVAGLLGFLTLSSPTNKAISLTLIVLGASGLFIDFFSKERAVIYLAQLEEVRGANLGTQYEAGGP